MSSNDDYVGRHVGRAIYRSAQQMAIEYPEMPASEISDRVYSWVLRSLAANLSAAYGDERARQMFERCFDQGTMMLEEFDLQMVTFRSPPK